MDVDDLSGYGPENVNIDFPVNGAYTIAVSYYSGSEPTFATLKIFVNGALAHEDGLQLDGTGSFWEVAQVDWSGNAIITPLNNTTAPSGSCLSAGSFFP